MTTKTTIGFWLVILALVLGGAVAVLGVLGVLAPVLIAEGLMAKGLVAWLVAGGAAGVVVLLPVGLALWR